MDERLPNLIIAGVSKGGTTALAGYLGQHHDVCLARSQEVFYALARNATASELQPHLHGFRLCRAERYLCEHGATYYFGGPTVIGAIQRWQPQARIVMTIRDPVERLWSAYNYTRGSFRLPREMSFEDYVTESERQHGAGIDTFPDPVWREMAIGFYDQTIVPWLDTFGDRIRILFFEQWTRSPASALMDLCRWLEIDADPVTRFDYSTRNRTVLHRNRAVKDVAYALNRRVTYLLTRTPRLKERLRRTYYSINSDRVSDPMRPETRRRVLEIYRSSNARLARALGARGYEDVPPWLHAQ